MNIGFIAHDERKTLMENFCIAYRRILSKHQLFATGTTGRMIEEISGLNIHKYLAGHVGGVQQLAVQIEQNEIDLLIFFQSSQRDKSHEPNVKQLIRLCDIHCIPMATNLATAEMLVKSLDRGEMEWREIYR